MGRNGDNKIRPPRFPKWCILSVKSKEYVRHLKTRLDRKFASGARFQPATETTCATRYDAMGEIISRRLNDGLQEMNSRISGDGFLSRF